MIRLISRLTPLPLILLVFVSVGAQSKVQQPLELSAEVISESYCAVNPDSASVELKLRLRYRNVGAKKLILYNGHDLFYQTLIRNMAGSAATLYQVWVVNSRYFDQEIEPIDQATPSKVFLTLSPGSVYVKETVVGVGLVNTIEGRGDSQIISGEHTLQLIVSTWYKSRSLAEKLRQEWQRKGLLWAEPLVTVPIRFMARRPQSLLPCKSSSRNRDVH
jgi:hypothetical protein